MADKVIIDIYANFTDNTKKKAQPLMDYLTKLDAKVAKLSGKKVSTRLDAVDNASSKLGEVGTKAEQFARKTFRATLGVADGVTKSVSAIAGTVKGCVGAGYNFTVGLIDKVTAPARNLVGKLNSVLGVAGLGISAYGLVVNPVQMQVDYENLTTAFDVLLGGEDKAQQRIDDLTTFAGQTPFTRDEIYKANRILQVYTGDALGATDALGGVKMVGDITAGVDGDFNSVATWIGRLYSAMEGGKPVGEMTSALQDMGAMGSAGREKLEALTKAVANGSKTIKDAWPEAVAVFSQFDGIMEKQSNKLGNLLLGVKSFINNNVLKKIGSGIGSELSPALARFRDWRGENKALIAEMGAGVEQFAAKVTGRGVSAVETLTGKISAMRSSEQWQEADLFGKAAISFDTLIGQPFSSWWDSTGKGMVSRKLSSAGAFLGQGVTKSLISLLGFDLNGAVDEGFDLGGAFLGGFTNALGGSQLRLAFGRALERLPDLGKDLWGKLLDGGRWLKINWQENIAGPFTEWWGSGGKEVFTEKGAELGRWLGEGLTRGAQWLSSGILSLLGIENEGAFAEAASVGQSFWGAFTGAIDGDAISTAISDAASGVWSKLPGWAQVLLGGYGISKAAGLVSPVIGFGKSALSLGQDIGSIIGSAAGGTGILGFGANAAIAMGGGNLSPTRSMSVGGLSALGLGAVGGGVVGAGTLISGIGDIAQAAGSQGPESTYYGWRGGSKIGGVGAGALAGAALGSVLPGVGTLIGGLIGAGLGGLGGIFLGDNVAAWASSIDEPLEEYQKRMAGLDQAMDGYSARSKEAVKQTKLTGAQFKEIEKTKLTEWYGDVSLSAQEAGEMAQRAFADIMDPDTLRRASAFEDAAAQAGSSFASLQDSWSAVQKLEWKLDMGIDLSQGEKQSFLSSVESVVSSAQNYLNDEEFQITAGMRLLLGTDGDDDIISGTSAYFGLVRGELDQAIDDLEQELQEAVTIDVDGDIEINWDESKIQESLDKIAEIQNQVASASQAAKLDRISLEFGGGNLNEESIAQVNASLDAYEQETSGQFLDAYEQTMNSLHLQKNSGIIDDKTFLAESGRAKETYDDKVDDLKRDVAGKKLDFSQPFYDNVLEDSNSMVSSAADKLTGTIDWFDWSFEGVRYDKEKGGSYDWTAWLEGKLNTPDLESALEQTQAEFSVVKKELEEQADLYRAAGEKIPKELLDGLKQASAVESGDFSLIYADLFEKLAQAAEDSGFDDVADAMRSKGEELLESFGSGAAKANETTRSDIQAGYYDVGRTVEQIYDRPFQVEADVNVRINPIVQAKQVALGVSTVGGIAGNALLSITGYATGGIVRGRQLSWLDEEERGEAVIPLNPARRQSALNLWAETGQLLGVGGSPEASWPGLPLASTPVAAGGTVVEMGGVTVQITVQGNGGSAAEDIRSNLEEIASQVAGVIADKVGPTLNNMPARA